MLMNNIKCKWIILKVKNKLHRLGFEPSDQRLAAPSAAPFHFQNRQVENFS